MFTKIIKSDLKNSKLVSLTILTFILFASFLLSTVGMLAVNLYASVNLFSENAKAPHFLQMHMGEFDAERMLRFAKDNDCVLDYQAMPFLNLDSSEILVNGTRFSENSQDNGFSCQSENFDFLLDLEGNIVHPKEGEVYIPLVYYTNGLLATGDRISVSGRELSVKGPVRDALMSSMLSSSKRFLINPSDYEKIKDAGREEILIEFLLKDLSKVDIFQADYVNAKLESNGPTITYSIIKFMNALSDGIMIAILALVAFLIVVVSFLCIRLTLAAKIEDEYRTIGVLKAIGLRLSSIKKIYGAKYAFLSLLACTVGLLFTAAFSGLFLKRMRIFFGENGAALPAALSALAGAAFIFFIVMLYIGHFLGRLKKLSAADAINAGIIPDNASNLRSFKLRKQGLLSTDIFLGVNQVLTRKKSYLTFVLILIIASFVMVLPVNVHSSIASDSFITYMGVGNGEAMIVLPGAENLDDLNARLNGDSDIESFVIHDNKSYEFMLNDNTVSKMWTSLGNQNKFPVSYAEGRPPQGGDEIALSHLNASSLGKKTGDSICLIVNRQRKDLIITGIYSDITNGGKTARAAFSDNSTPSLSISVIMNFKDDADMEGKLKSFEEAYPNAKVYHIETYRDAVFGSTIDGIKTSAVTAMALAIGLTFLITLLFVNMLIAKDRRNISILKSLGFTSGSLCKQYMTGSLMLVALGIIFGMLLVSSAGQSIAAAFIEGVGIANFKFHIDRRFAFFIAPLCMAASVFIGTYLSTRSIKEMKVSDYIRR